MRKNFKNQTNKIKKKDTNGITLIALVITIIVLLILAGISISAISGNNSIINRTITAKEQNEISEEKEALELSVTKSMGKNKYGNLLKDELEEQLNIDLGEGTTEVTSLTDDLIKVKFIQSKRNYQVDSNGEISEYITPDYAIKVVFDAGSGTFSNASNQNIVKYEYIEVNKKQEIEKHIYTDTFNEEGVQIDTTSAPQSYTTTKTAKVEGATKLKIKIKHGKDAVIRAIKSVPQAEPALWECSNSNTGTEEFEIMGDTVNIYYGGPLGGINDYYGFYATIKGYDSNGKVITKDLEEMETKLVIKEGELLTPTWEEGVFRGWYFDSNYTTKAEFDEDNIITNSNYQNITLYAKWATETIFKDLGGIVRLATGVAGQSDYDPVPALYFKKSNTALSNAIEVQTEESAYPIYMKYDSSTKTVYWFSEVKPKLRGNVAMFLYWKKVENIDLTGIDMTEVTGFSRRTGFYPPNDEIPLSKIIFDESYQN